MAHPQFVHLHNHSEYSLLDGACRVKQMVKRAADLDMPAVALSDHGVMYGAIQFYQAAKEAGVKPIIGCEVYVAKGNRTDREARGSGHYYHLMLHAKNETGYRNLLKLVSIAHLEGYYYKPRVDREVLQAHSEGLICMSGCLAGEVAQQVIDGEDREALRTIAEHQEIFGKENYYLELQDHDISEQKKVNQFLLAASGHTAAPLVASNDVHYLNAEDAQPHDILLCIQTGSTASDPKRMRFSTNEFYFKETEQMVRLFGGFPGAIERTLEIADRCNLEIDFGRKPLPSLPLPEGRTPEEHLRMQAWDGLERRYPNAGPEVRERLQYELDTIIQCNFAQYLLIVQDFSTFARSRSILAGVRGSAAGSLVCYCLGITSVDPIYHKLTFERFLNPERVQMPDVDFDFQDDRRQEMIDYASERYGRDHVAQIVTFGTLAARAAIRDAGRAMEIPLADVDRVAKLVPTQPVGMTIDKALELNPDFKRACDTEERTRELVDMARKLEGISRHASTHAAGVVIADQPLTEYVPLQKSADGAYIAQHDMNDLGELGLLKMDFLGLINLSIIQRCLDLIRQNKGVELDLQSIPVDDVSSYDLLGRAETTGMFQLESSGMRRYIRELKPQSISELAAMVALYRPGPMAHIPTYISNKFGRTKIRYMHPRLEPILSETYGVIVYQDQVMQIVQAIAGFTLGHADILRRAMGKKDPEKMAHERQNFVDGAQKNGIQADVATGIFDLIEPFAGYAFNKAHAVCYGTIAYQTAYLKANYPVEYLTAILACHAENQDKVALYVEEARRLGIEVLPPDINHSNADFTISKDGKGIRFGLSAIKNCGRALVEGIVEERNQNGEFRSLADFVARASQAAGFNRAAFECLARVGALQDLHANRRAMVEAAETLVAKVSRSLRNARTGQAGLFEGSEDETALNDLSIEVPDVPEYERGEMLATEKDLLGLYVSDHPLNQHAAILKERTNARVQDLPDMDDGSTATVGGVITNIRPLFTKAKGEKMAIVSLEDTTGTVKVLVFPKVFAQVEPLIEKENLVLVTAKVQHGDTQGDEKGPVELISESIVSLVGAGAGAPAEEPSVPVAEMFDATTAITIRLGTECGRRLQLLQDIFSRHKGVAKVFFKIGEWPQEMTIRSDVRVDVSSEMAREVQSLLGPESLVMVQN